MKPLGQPACIFYCDFLMKGNQVPVRDGIGKKRGFHDWKWVGIVASMRERPL